jgi:hypothetical protein
MWLNKFTATFNQNVDLIDFQIWNLYIIRDIDLLEKVQRRATKIPRQLRNLQYEDGLTELKLTTLKERRDRGDLIEIYMTTIPVNSYQLCAPKRTPVKIVNKILFKSPETLLDQQSCQCLESVAGVSGACSHHQHLQK